MAPPRRPSLSVFRAGTGLLLGLAMVVGAGSAAVAREVTTEEFRRLAAQAIDDEGALEQLRDIDEVDGRPFDFDATLGKEDGKALDRRLTTLAGDADETAPDASSARDETQAILRQERFQPVGLPRPFRGLLQRLGRIIEPVLDPIRRAFLWLADRVPGGTKTVLALVGVLIAVLVAVFVRRYTRRRTRALTTPGMTRPSRPDDDPHALDRRAVEAERAGDFVTALRLRFKAGLIRLDSAEVISYRASLTSREVAEAVGSRTFDELAADFDRIVYGHRAAGSKDLDRARSGWPLVLQEARAS
jgi:hypothetical protein